MKSNRKILDGNGAAAEAICAVDVDLIAAYPITPQSPLVEQLTSMAEQKKFDCKCVCVESEHSAMSYILGSQLAGARSTTATASVGLALMHEVINMVSGCRVPIVMPVVNRALAAPWSLWCDHQDTMAERDSGWLQLYAETPQEVFDFILMAYKIAENENVLLPVMVCMDGFYVSHAMQPVEVIEQKDAKAYVGKYVPKNLYLDEKKPIFINNLVSSSEFMEMRYQQEVAFRNAKEVIPAVMKEFGEKFDRNYQVIESYCVEDAEAVIVGLGSMCGTIKQTVIDMRKAGYKVGMVKISVFRPFPYEEVREAIKGIKKIGIIDRSSGFGAGMGPLALEVKSAVDNDYEKVVGFVAGLGGRDISEFTVQKAFEVLFDEENKEQKVWLDVKENAFELRENKEVD